MSFPVICFNLLHPLHLTEKSNEIKSAQGSKALCRSKSAYVNKANVLCRSRRTRLSVTSQGFSEQPLHTTPAHNPLFALHVLMLFYYIYDFAHCFEDRVQTDNRQAYEASLDLEKLENI